MLMDYDFTAVKMGIVFFWVATPCSLLGGYERFGGTYCLCLLGIFQREALCSSEMLIIYSLRSWNYLNAKLTVKFLRSATTMILSILSFSSLIRKINVKR
jgi:hypothetical protein